MGSFKAFVASKKNSQHFPPDNISRNGYFCSELESQTKNLKIIAVTYSDSSQMGRHCLCDTIKPILMLAQAFGLIPLSLQHIQMEGALGDSRDCRLVYCWRSPAVIVNVVLIITFCTILPFARTEIKNRMSAVFTGTDLYAFAFQTLAMVFETSALLTFGRIYRHKFSQGWKSLNNVFHEICDHADDLRKIKFGSYIVFVFTIIEGICFFAFMFMTSHRSIGVYQSCIALLCGTTIITLTLLIPYTISTLFLFVCLLVRSHFLKISEMLKTIISKKQNSAKLYTKIDSIRVLHEQLCSTVTCFEDFFGVQVLLTLCTCCFTIVVGAYATILQGEEISAPQVQELTGVWAMQLYCAAISLFLILVSGQLVTNAAASAAPVLNSISMAELDEKSQQQIVLFLQKVSAFPTQIKAVNVTSISTTFLASAATNIITYLLVLMQFKLSFESWYAKNETDSSSTTAPKADSYIVISNTSAQFSNY